MEKVQLTMAGNVYSSTGQLEKADEFYKKSLRIALEGGDKPLEVTVYGDLGAVYRNLGELEKAVVFLHKSLQFDLEMGNRMGEGVCLIRHSRRCLQPLTAV